YRAVRVSDTVLELEAAPGWCAFFRLVGQGGVPVVGEVRIYPVERHPFRPLGIWSGEALGSVASVPAGGITARSLWAAQNGPPAPRGPGAESGPRVCAGWTRHT